MFQFLEHPSEEYVEIRARTVQEVFQDGALALFEIMTDTSVVKPAHSFQVQLEAPDRKILFVDWLNQLILLHEVEKVFLSKFQVQIASNGNWKLSAILHGEKIGKNHERRAQAKSATFGQFEWNETPDGHCVRFVVDI